MIAPLWVSKQGGFVKKQAVFSFSYLPAISSPGKCNKNIPNQVVWNHLSQILSIKSTQTEVEEYLSKGWIIF